MEEKQNQTSKYEAISEQAHFDGEHRWNVFASFLLAQTVFTAFLLQSGLTTPLCSSRLGPCFAGLLGLILCLPWYATYRRLNAYYEYRIAQAREIEPSGWHRYSDDGKRFSEGAEVEVGNIRFKIPLSGRILKGTRAMPLTNRSII